MNYDNMAKGYNELHKEEQLKKLKIIKEVLDIGKKDRVLDVGCGTGFSREFLDCRWTGLEPSVKMAKQGTGIIIGKAEELPFKSCSFDIVISVTAIHNFSDIEKGLLEMKRVGKKFAFSILKKAKSFEKIKNLIAGNFNIIKEVDEGIDLIIFAEKL